MQQVSCGPLEAKVQALKTRSASPTPRAVSAPPQAKTPAPRAIAAPASALAVGQAPIT